VAAIFCAAAGSGNQAAPPADTQAPPPTAENEEPRKPTAAEPDPETLSRALQLIRQGRHAEARRFLEPVVARHPESTRALLFLALTYHKENHWEPARELYERVLELDPDFHECKVSYGWCLYYLGEPVRAKEMFEAYLSVKPDYLDAIFALGLIAFDGDDVEAARKRFTRAVELAQAQGDRPREALSRFRLADVLVRTGDLESARIELLRSIGLDPTNPKSYFKLSRVLQRLGDDEGAARARQKYEEVLTRNPPRGEMR